MKFLSIFSLDPSAMTGPPDPQLMADMDVLMKELMGAGKMVDTGGRAPTGLTFRVKRANGQVNVTDGPFAESKEIVGGFALLNVNSKDEAVALTERFLGIMKNGACDLLEVSETPTFDS
jgi:hypothetical protein